jgi:hypothetical protein
MKTAASSKRIALENFRQRARLYRLAAVVADAPRDVAMFHDLAAIMERTRGILREQRLEAIASDMAASAWPFDKPRPARELCAQAPIRSAAEWT